MWRLYRDLSSPRRHFAEDQPKGCKPSSRCRSSTKFWSVAVKVACTCGGLSRDGLEKPVLPPRATAHEKVPVGQSGRGHRLDRSRARTGLPRLADRRRASLRIVWPTAGAARLSFRLPVRLVPIGLRAVGEEHHGADSRGHGKPAAGVLCRGGDQGRARADDRGRRVFPDRNRRLQDQD